jgi:hypothetical protein
MPHGGVGGPDRGVEPVHQVLIERGDDVQATGVDPL